MAEFKITQKQFQNLLGKVDGLEKENKELWKLFGGLAPKKEEKPAEEKTEPEQEEKPKKKGLLDGIFGGE